MTIRNLHILVGAFLLAHTSGWAQTNVSLCHLDTLSLETFGLIESSDSTAWLWSNNAIPSEWDIASTDSTLIIPSATSAYSGLYELIGYSTTQSDTDTVVISSVLASWDVLVLEPFELFVPNGTLTVCPEAESSSFYPILTTGGSGGVTWNWFIQSSDTTQAWNNPDSPAISLNAASDTAGYFAQAIDNMGCGSIESELLTVEVLNGIEAGTLAGTGNGNDLGFCFGSSVMVTSTSPVTSSDFTIEWNLYDEDNMLIQSQTGTDLSFIIESLEENVNAEAVYSTTEGCTAQESAALDLLALPELTNVSINWDDAQSTLCFNTAHGTASVTDNPNDFTPWEWQWNVDNGSGFQPLPGANGTSLPSTPLSTTTSFNLSGTSTDGCGSIGSNLLVADVFPELEDPTIAFLDATEDMAICFNEESPILELELAPAAGMQFTWQWQADGLDIAGQDTQVLSPFGLNASTTFQLVATSIDGCGILNSNQIAIEVLPELIPGELTTNLDTICFDAASIFSSTVASGGDGNFDVQWYFGTGVELNFQSNWQGLVQPINNATESFMALVQYGSTYGCGTVSSDTVSVHVFDALQSGVLTESQSICFDTSPDPFEVTPASGGNEDFQYTWLTYTEGTDEPIAVADGTSWSPEPLTTTITVSVLSESEAGCGTIESNTVEVYVYEELIAGAITAAESPICYGFSSGFEASNALSGENISYQWWASQQGQEYAEIQGATDLNGQTESLPEATSLAVTYTSEDGCGTVWSEAAEVEVLPELQAAEIIRQGTSSPVCYGFTGPTLTTSLSATGGTQEFDYAWQIHNSNEDWTTVSTNPNFFSFGILTETTDVRLVATSTAGCGGMISNQVTIEVYNQIQAGIAAGNQTICYGETPELITSMPAIGANSQFNYQWYTGAPPAPIESQTSEVLVLSPLFETTSFFIVATSDIGCGSVTSNLVEVAVWDELIAGTLSENNPDSLCFESNAEFNAFPEASGNDMLYQWYFGEYIENQPPETLSPISGEVSLTTSIFQLNSSFWLSMEYISPHGCGSEFASPVYYHVLPEMQASSIILEGGGQDTSICFNAVLPFAVQINSAIGANGQFSYQWETSENGDTWSLLDSGGDTLQIEGLPWSDNFIRNMGFNAACGSVASDNLFIHVYDEFVPSIAGNDQLICFGTSPAQLFGPGAQGGGGNYNYQWYAVVDTDTIPIDGALETSWTAAELLSSETYILQSESNKGCGSGFSNLVSIEVADSLISGSIELLESDEFCAGESIEWEATAATGGIGDFALNWFYTNSSDSNWELFSTDELVATTPSLTDSTLVYLEYVNACGTIVSNEALVIVNPLPVTPPISGDLVPCLNSHNNLLEADPFDPGLQYSWEAISTNTEISSGETGHQILFNVDSTANAEDLTFFLLLINDSTGCTSDSTYQLTASEELAPSLGVVIKKPNIDILVCSDSTECAQYMWGAIDISSNEELLLENGDEQYILIEDYDPNAFIYFVDVWYDCGDGAGCETRMYYEYTPFVSILEITTDDFLIYPNPSAGQIRIKANFTWSEGVIFSSTGKIIDTFNSANPRIDLSSLPAGIYILSILDSEGKSIRRSLILTH